MSDKIITNIQLSGLTCGACQKLVSKRIKSVKGVEEVNVELSGKTAIKARREILEDEIKKALEGTKYIIIS